MSATSVPLHNYRHGVWGPAWAGTTASMWKQLRETKNAYASPSVSNIAAFIASCADLPAQTTYWNAG
jgi:hypothetical protein